ncbi:glycosyltransferase family 4 protein [Photobacterium sp. ZSDE20]|nr:glycosyltransferase family 4 protein [Photobacterium sp. ZSDE20]
MKVLQVTTISKTLEAFLLPLADRLRSGGYIVDAAAEGILKSETVISKHNKVFEVNFSRNPKKIFTLIKAMLDIRKIIVSNAYDIVHVHTPVASFLTRLACFGMKNVSVIYTVHGFHFIEGNSKWKNFVFISLEKLASYFTDYMLLINEKDYNSAVRYSFLPKERLFLTGGVGVCTETYTVKDNLAISQAQGFRPQNNDLNIIHVAELNHNKNHTVVLNALCLLRKNLPCLKFRYMIVGMGPLEQELKLEVKELGLDDNVAFLGYRKDIPKLLASSDVFVLSSLREGLPRSIQEAMLNSLPVIASDIRGCQDLLAQGGGFLVHPNDPVAWCRALTKLSIKEERKEVALNSRKFIEDNYSFETTLNQVQDIYEKIKIESN